MNNKTMSKKPLVSVVITCYNYAEYVGEAIESVLSQTYKNLELIIINDGSTDNSFDIINTYKNSAKIINRENKGIVYTRNEGLRIANGGYICFLDADDWIDPDFIKKTLKKADKDNLDIVYTQAKVFGRTEFITKYPEFNIEFLKHDNFINCTALVKETVFKNRKYDEYLEDKGNEDWDFFLDACLDGAKAGLVDEPLLHYRKHSETKSRQDNFEGSFKELLIRHHVLNKQNAKHPDKIWYFSAYINMLKNSIDLYLENEENKQKVAALERKFANRVYRKIRKQD